MPYTAPQNVSAPKEHWQLAYVLNDGGPGNPAYAVGYWDGVRCIATRWNGDSDNVGWPRIFVHPAWHILPSQLHSAVIGTLSDYRMQILALRFLAGEEV
jgi:hypothetical protein